MQAALTREERQLAGLMRIWTWLFAFGGIVFLLFGDWVLYGGNYLSVEILKLDLPAMPMPTERFWLVLTTSLMVTITTLCHYIAKDIRSHLLLTSLLLVSKLTSTLVFFSAFFWDRPYFNYLLGALFCDGPIFVITFLFYRRAIRSLTPECLKKPTASNPP